MNHSLETTLTYDQLMEVGIASHSCKHVRLHHIEEFSVKPDEFYNVMRYHLEVNKSFCNRCEANVRRLEKGEPMVYAYSNKIEYREDGSVWDCHRNPDGTWEEKPYNGTLLKIPKPDITIEPITIWAKWDEEKHEYIFNHIENGHAEGTSPTIKFPSQEKAWKGHSWEKEFAHLDENYQIVKS